MNSDFSSRPPGATNWNLWKSITSTASREIFCTDTHLCSSSLRNTNWKNQLIKWTRHLILDCWCAVHTNWENVLFVHAFSSFEERRNHFSVDDDQQKKALSAWWKHVNTNCALVIHRLVVVVIALTSSTYTVALHCIPRYFVHWRIM